MKHRCTHFKVLESLGRCHIFFCCYRLKTLSCETDEYLLLATYYLLLLTIYYPLPEYSNYCLPLTIYYLPPYYICGPGRAAMRKTTRTTLLTWSARRVRRPATPTLEPISPQRRGSTGGWRCRYRGRECGLHQSH